MKKKDQKEVKVMTEKMLKEAKAQISKSPLSALTFMCNIAPRDAFEHMQGCIAEILEVEIPKYAKIRAGHFKDLDPAKQTIEAMFLQSMAHLRQHGDLSAGITRTVEDAAQDIAKAADEGVKRMLLGEKLLNVGAYLDICAAHAKMTSALANLMTAPKYAPAEDAKDGDSD